MSNPQMILVDVVGCPNPNCGALVDHVEAHAQNAFPAEYATACPHCGNHFDYGSEEIERIDRPLWPAAAGGAPGSDDARGRPHGGSLSYLESNRKIVDGAEREKERKEKKENEEIEPETHPRAAEPEYLICPTGCKNWFCERCCVHLGLLLRNRLLEVLQNWRFQQMWTLTIDPELFPSPEAAFRYVGKRRSISELVRAIHKMKYLVRRDYFCVVEWQKKTEMPHYHLLVEAEHLPFDVVCEVWNRNRPESAGPVQGLRPGFGSVRFSAPKFADAKHAAFYVTKYLIKHPAHGYPKWVLEFEGSIKRYSTGRNFWGRNAAESSGTGEAPAVYSPKVQDERKRKKRDRRTVGERINRCCKQAALMKVEGERREFIARCPEGYAELRERVGLPAVDKPLPFAVDEETARTLRQEIFGIVSNEYPLAG